MNVVILIQVSNQRSADIHTNSRGLRTSCRDLLQNEDLPDENSSEDGPLEKAAEAGAIFAVIKLSKLLESEKFSPSIGALYQVTMYQFIRRFSPLKRTIRTFIIWLTDFVRCDWSIPGP